MCRTDGYFVQRCLNGRPEEFRHLIERYQGVLLSQLTGLLGSADRAEEAAQEAFVRAYFALGRLRRADSFFSWLVGIATRVAADQQRRDSRRRQAVRAAAELATPAPGAASAGAADQPLRRAVAGLPEDYRQAILLRYYAGLSCAELAERLGKPLGTVTKTLSRAYAMLREALAGDEGRPKPRDHEVDS